MSAWTALEDERDRPPMRVWSRAELDAVTLVRKPRSVATRILDKAVIDTLKREYLEGSGLQELAVRHHLNRSTIRDALIAAGANIRSAHEQLKLNQQRGR